MEMGPSGRIVRVGPRLHQVGPSFQQAKSECDALLRPGKGVASQQQLDCQRTGLVALDEADFHPPLLQNLIFGTVRGCCDQP
jgi:hypothetical protein